MCLIVTEAVNPGHAVHKYLALNSDFCVAAKIYGLTPVAIDRTATMGQSLNLERLKREKGRLRFVS